MTVLPSESASIDRYTSLFESLKPGFPSLTGEDLNSFRESGLQKFCQTGFPTMVDEDWRYTSLKSLYSLEPLWAPPACQAEVPQDFIAGIPQIDSSRSRLVFVDGSYCEKYSNILPQPHGVDVMPLCSALKLGLIRPEELGQYTCDGHSNSFVPLNDAFFQDGLFLRAAKGMEVNGIVEVLYLSSGLQSNVQFPRQLVILGEDASATVLEQYHQFKHGIVFTNAVSEIFLGDQSHLEWVKLQMEPDTSLHFGSYFIQATQKASFLVHSIDIGAALSRNSLKTVLNGSHVHGVLNGLYITKGRQMSDHHMVVEHNQPACESHEYFNGILDDHSKAVFHGRIYVDQKGQKTDAKQTNKNILLTDDVVVDTKPQLEIYADDVKCTHGATVGQLDEDAQFYLQARGIPRLQARKMLIHAFASEIVERVENESIRGIVDKVVWDTLDGLPSIH
ncbi:MAG: Fe-S cluster assembly protein SufD [Verrucomicrobia bacterium]|nr:Fe-S cluster assembly protein SufD [Verrucomicrobiota bacterium]